MFEVYRLEELGELELDRLCSRNPALDPGPARLCRRIFREVAKSGDAAIRKYSRRYDGVEPVGLELGAEEFGAARRQLSTETLEALRRAARNIEVFHAAQLSQEQPVEVEPGIRCWRSARPIPSVGLYVPGGTAPLPSTALMLGIPARLAGCPRMVLCVPPRADGSVAPEILAAAEIAGISRVFRIGGIQAIAAMALGTESVPRVDKIFGPGNRYVQMAKMTALGHGVSIDMMAGPSEVLVIADGSARAEIVAGDLISQAEHDSDSRAVLVSDSERLVREVRKAIEVQILELPRRELAEEALRQSFGLLVESLEDAFRFSNRYAPEHLVLQLEGARRWVDRVDAAGSVFVGPWSPQVAGDYASGTNHTLPTGGTARSASGISVDSFLTKITFQELTRRGLRSLAPTLETLAQVEGLEGHRRAVRLRTELLKDAWPEPGSGSRPGGIRGSEADSPFGS